MEAKTKRKKAAEDVVTIAIPAIIENDRFDEVQQRLKQRAPRVTAPRLVNSPCLLTGMTFCAPSSSMAPSPCARRTCKPSSNASRSMTRKSVSLEVRTSYSTSSSQTAQNQQKKFSVLDGNGVP